MQAEGFGSRAPCVWLVFSKFLELALPWDTGQVQDLLEQGLRDSSAGLHQCHAQLQDIYLFISGVTLRGTSAWRAVLAPCSRCQTAVCSAPASITHWPRSFRQLQPGAHTANHKPTFLFARVQTSPPLALTCMFVIHNQAFGSGFPSHTPSLSPPADEAQWYCPWLFHTQEGQTADGICPKPAQTSCPFLFICWIPSPSQPCRWVRVEEGTDRSTEIIIWLILPLRPRLVLAWTNIKDSLFIPPWDFL